LSDLALRCKSRFPRFGYNFSRLIDHPAHFRNDLVGFGKIEFGDFAHRAEDETLPWFVTVSEWKKQPGLLLRC
jgi:hypothetical protein